MNTEQSQNSKQSTSMKIRLPQTVYDRCKALAEEERRTIHNMVVVMVEDEAARRCKEIEDKQ
jgi:predicted transcriptional regulator